MIRLTIDLDEAVLAAHWAWRRERTAKDFERADMLWLSSKKGLIVDGVRIRTIVVKQIKLRTKT